MMKIHPIAHALHGKSHITRTNIFRCISEVSKLVLGRIIAVIC